MIANTFGVKGKAASAWLAAQGITVPEQPNTWRATATNSRILRLGRGEYLLEGNAAESLNEKWQDGQADLYRVPRYDAVFELSGEAGRKVLAEVCALDIHPKMMRDGVLMTLAAGISVTVIYDDGIYDAEVYRLWCDATYGNYLQQTLQEISD